MPPHRAVRLVTKALPLNEGPEEQVEDLLDVLRAQPAPVIHQQQTKHVQGQVSQSCLRVCQEEEEGQMKKPTQCRSKPGGKYHPKLTLFPNSLLAALLPSLTPCATCRRPAAAQPAWGAWPPRLLPRSLSSISTFIQAAPISLPRGAPDQNVTAPSAQFLLS